jgi:hypothetical protein
MKYLLLIIVWKKRSLRKKRKIEGNERSIDGDDIVQDHGIEVRRGTGLDREIVVKRSIAPSQEIARLGRIDQGREIVRTEGIAIEATTTEEGHIHVQYHDQGLDLEPSITNLRDGMIHENEKSIVHEVQIEEDEETIITSITVRMKEDEIRHLLDWRIIIILHGYITLKDVLEPNPFQTISMVIISKHACHSNLNWLWMYRSWR